MILTIVAVYDSGISAYGRPIFMRARGEALRTFQDEVNRAEDGNMMFKHPEHFRLDFVGTFDDQTGELAAPARPEKLADGVGVIVAQVLPLKGS